MKKIVKPHKVRKPSASTDVPSFARGKDQILKSPASLQRRKENELGEFDVGYRKGKDQVQKDQSIINWMTNWLNNRQEQLRNNYLDSSGIFSRNSYGGPHPINALTDVIQGNPEGYTTTKEILQSQLNNLNKSRAIVTDDAEKVFPGRDGLSMLQQIKWDMDKIAGKTYNNNLIFYNPENGETDVQQIYPSVRVHESTHTLGNIRGSRILPYREYTPQEEVIRKKYSKYFDNTGYSKSDAEYLSLPDEIYSRMMQLRYDSKLSPNQKVDDKWIKANQKLIQKHNLNFKNGKLKDMLNEIAYNPIYNDDVYYADKGKDSSLIKETAAYNAWRQTLPKNLQIETPDYDLYGAFQAGLQPEWNDEDKSYHLGSRDPKTGKILKKPGHPTFGQAIYNDMLLGYYPIYKDGEIYTENPFEYNSGKDSGIHIKKKNRGKFTALKKRTGKSASWFKAHGTPAQKKMAVFALNARKWHH